jgi:hypothetical protein
MALEAKRTLVKSAPELWAEISDVAALARHLGELGEIRITRAQPEELVEWEGDRATGTVRLEPSGWGTRVTLTAEPTPPPEEPAAPEAAEPAAITPEPATPEPPDPAPTPRTGFFARLFRRFRRPAPAIAAAPDPSVAVEPAEPDVYPASDVPPAVVAEAGEPRVDTPEPAEPPVDTAEPDVPPTVAAEPDEPVTDAPTPDDDAVLAILTGTLDRLGSAHHRPFSRG